MENRRNSLPCGAGSVDLKRTGPEDLARLRELFGDPAFSAWSGGDLSDSEIRIKYLGGRMPDVECFLILCDDAVAGFAQLHAADAGGPGGGMDMVLLEAARGRGIGTAVVRELVRRARREKRWSRFTVDPDVSNERGVAFWRKVGFVPEQMISNDEGREPYWVMAWPEDEPS